MRSSNKRSRNKNNRNRPNSVGNVVNRVFDSSGPEGKVRGTPQQIIDKYNQLARDAQLSNDRVNAENFQQHAEHYMRMLSEATREQEARREEQERQNRERQLERDRERAARQERDAADANTRAASKPADPGSNEQPDVVDMSASGESGLVETPESKDTAEEKPKPKRRSSAPRKPRSRKPNADAQASSDKPDQPEPPQTPEAAE